ncbi:hypothetical protein ABWK46_13850 [Peribacillus frigoritolerans]
MKNYEILLPNNWLAETPGVCFEVTEQKSSGKGSGFLESTGIKFKKKA